MNDKKECKIIQDLLPNYMENLTSIQTNEYVEEHIKNCQECKKMLENMQKEIPADTKGKNEKEVKYMKKYRNKMRTLSFILLAIFLVFVGTTTRKAIILIDLAQKAEETVKNTNYHMTTYGYYKGEAYKSEELVLNDKKRLIYTMYSERGTYISQHFVYKTEQGEIKRNFYEEQKGGKKKARLGIVVDTEHTRLGAEMRPLRTENIVHLLLNAVITSVQSRSLNGKECYLVTNFKGNYVDVYDGAGMYFDKENGLMVGATECEVHYSDGITRIETGREIEYEFGTVTEKDFIEPDINEYEILK